MFHVLPMLQAGRRVVTNLPLIVDHFKAIDPSFEPLIVLRTVAQPIRGRWVSRNAGTDKPLYELFEDGHVEDPPVDAFAFGGVWDYFDEWKGEDGNGPAFVIDECHISMPKIGTNPQMIEWFKMHRHFNADVLLMTQQFRDMSQPIAGLIAILVKVRKADILGKANQYIRKTHGGYRGAVISTEVRKYQPQYFSLYKSHTQGNAVSENSARDMKTPLNVKLDRLKWGFFGSALLLGLYFFVPGCTTTTAKPGAQPVKAQSPLIAAPVSALMQSASPASAADPEAVPDPYKTKGLHIVGYLSKQGAKMYVFAVSQAGLTIATVTDQELRQAGFRLKPLTECVVAVRWPPEPYHSVTCDAPRVAAGHDSNPIVLQGPPVLKNTFDLSKSGAQR